MCPLIILNLPDGMANVISEVDVEPVTVEADSGTTVILLERAEPVERNWVISSIGVMAVSDMVILYVKIIILKYVS